MHFEKNLFEKKNSIEFGLWLTYQNEHCERGEHDAHVGDGGKHGDAHRVRTAPVPLRAPPPRQVTLPDPVVSRRKLEEEITCVHRYVSRRPFTFVANLRINELMSVQMTGQPKQ